MLLRGLMRSFSVPFPCSRSIVHLTSAAVNGLPSCHLTPWRSGKVSSVPSSFQFQPVASSGTIVSGVFCGSSCLNMTRLLNTPIIGRLTAAVDSSSIDTLAGLAKCPIRSVPPACCASAGDSARASVIASSSGPAAQAPSNDASLRLSSRSDDRLSGAPDMAIPHRRRGRPSGFSRFRSGAVGCRALAATPARLSPSEGSFERAPIPGTCMADPHAGRRDGAQRSRHFRLRGRARADRARRAKPSCSGPQAIGGVFPSDA